MKYFKKKSKYFIAFMMVGIIIVHVLYYMLCSTSRHPFGVVNKGNLPGMIPFEVPFILERNMTRDALQLTYFSDASETSVKFQIILILTNSLNMKVRLLVTLSRLSY